MIDMIDLFNKYIMTIIDMLTGFYFFTKLLQKKIKLQFYLLFTVCGIAMIQFVPASRITEYGVYVILLTVSGIFICHTDWKPAILYAALIIEIMQLSYGIVNCLQNILYPMMASFNQKIVGFVFMLLGYLSLPLAIFCYHMICWYFSYFETIKKQYVFMILIPLLMMFSVGEYINSILYEMISGTDNNIIPEYLNRYHIFVIQLLEMASLFCFLFANKKLIQNFRLSTELSLLAQKEHSLNQYVEEAKTHYEKTKSFRHDIKNHITVVKKLLQEGKSEQALDYMKDMESMTVEMSFPYSTNNPVADILIENKLGTAQSLGINVSCTLILPYPCFVRDIDFCIILSNALDNAIHACKKIEDDTKKYILMTGRIQGDFILLEIENSFQGKGLFKMGTGLSNIKTVAEKYHGTMNVKTQGTTFILSVLLIIPQHSTHSSQQNGSSTAFDHRKI